MYDTSSERQEFIRHVCGMYDTSSERQEFILYAFFMIVFVSLYEMTPLQSYGRLNSDAEPASLLKSESTYGVL